MSSEAAAGTIVVDVHAHAIIPEVEMIVAGAPGLEAQRALELRRFGREAAAVNGPMIAARMGRLVDLGVRLDDMAAAGVDAQVVSPSPSQYHYWADADLARHVWRAGNRGIAAIVDAEPLRFNGFGLAPVQHPELMVEALDDAVVLCGPAGVEISSYSPGSGTGPQGDRTVELSDRRLELFWARAAELGAVVFLHPFGCSLDERLDRFYLSNTVAQPAENAVALSHLIFAGVLDRHPGLKIVAAHGGGLGQRGVLPRGRGLPEQYVVRLCKAADKRIDLVAFGAASRADVDTLAATLAAAGVRLVHEPKDLDTPGAGYGLRFVDNEGRTIEISAEVQTRAHRRIEEAESIPVRLSHVVVNSAAPEATVAFYTEHLGFRVSDMLMHPHMGTMMWFMRCNEWHHSFAVTRAPHASLHHASFELRGIDEYMRGSGRLLSAGIEKIWGPGRHLAGNNMFSYFLDPQGNTVEYTTELDTLDEDTWHPSTYDFTRPEVSDQWGTANQMNEFVAKKSFNDPDQGLFVAPPL